ncbi:Phosphatidylinositol transfer protein CSR1, partial [Frankliniella fusca]
EMDLKQELRGELETHPSTEDWNSRCKCSEQIQVRHEMTSDLRGHQEKQERAAELDNKAPLDMKHPYCAASNSKVLLDECNTYESDEDEDPDIPRRPTPRGLAYLSDVYELLEEYNLVARSRWAVNCAYPQSSPLQVSCWECGKIYCGTPDRLLKLLNHIESAHPTDKWYHLRQALKRYRMFIRRMAGALEVDFERKRKSMGMTINRILS